MTVAVGTARAGRPGLAVTGIVLLLVAATFVPLGYIVATLFSVGLDEAARLVFRPRVGELLRNTAGLVVLTVPVCVALGVGLAWLVERTDVPGAGWWGPILAAPLAVPAFVNSYGWVSVFPALHGLGAGVLITSMSYFPLVYLPVAATLRRLDPAVEESARALGSGSVAVFARIVLPQLRLAILGGALLISLHLLAEYGAFVMVRFDTFTTAIFEQYQSSFAGAAGSMLAGVLVLCCLVLLGGEAAVRGRARYARVGGGAPRAATRVRLGGIAIPALGVLGAVLVAALGVPLWTVLRWLRIGGAAVWDVDSIGESLAQTVGLAATAAVVTTLCAFPVAWIAVRSQSVFARIVEGCNYITSSLPGIVIALAMVTLTIRWLPGVYQTATMVLAAYTLMFLPRALVSVRAGLAQVPIGLEEVSRALGKSGPVTFLRVTLRLSAPAAAASAALVFVAVATELTATLLLAPNGTRTLAMGFWSASGELDYAGAAPYALIMIVVAIPVTYVLFTQSRKAAGL
ncbi:iron ABC transporter permease [Nocardia sp. CDC159]|uniref:Iron ABC transporter permease n=1 Tax=Nocardia pulmonis TaxID=2951408 RepID=A0A9X2EBG8_9NOCA|nr:MULTISPECIES: iron ABC transporter permease [Nocardia]MCM6777854.1 iron ABC transporter permease [Nocardia pulmonis]MCM6790738.1 iron ABC transporter permease [Nocardia sp. CDC159]